MESCVKRHLCPGDVLGIFSDSIGHAGTERRSCEGVVSTRFPHETHSCSIEGENERSTHQHDDCGPFLLCIACCLPLLMSIRKFF